MRSACQTKKRQPIRLPYNSSLAFELTFVFHAVVVASILRWYRLSILTKLPVSVAIRGETIGQVRGKIAAYGKLLAGLTGDCCLVYYYECKTSEENVRFSQAAGSTMRQRR
jgi:hypothetical protein